MKKRAEKEGSKKKEMITVEVQKEIIGKHKQGMQVAATTRFYKRSTSAICTVLKKTEELRGPDVAEGVMRASEQRPRVLEDVEKLLLGWSNEKQLAGEAVTENLSQQRAVILKQLAADTVTENLSADSSDSVSDSGSCPAQ
jgi:hypothetical protein